MASSRRYTPYTREQHPPTPPARWTRHRPPLGSLNLDPNAHQQGHAGRVDKGKQRAANQGAEPARQWKDAAALLQHSFTVHRIATLADFPLSRESTTRARFAAFSKALRAYLAQQLALGLDPDLRIGCKDALVARVEAGYVDIRLGGKDGVRPILVEVELSDDDGWAGSTSSARTAARTARFILLPALDVGAIAPVFPLLLVKSSIPALTRLFTSYLATRHDALLHPFRVPPPAMLALADQLVLHRDTSLESDLDASETTLATTLTLAFPPAVAHQGLSSMTLTLPPALLAPLCDTAPGNAGFIAGLESHLARTTGLRLEELALVRVGAGRGTFVHSGYGAGETGAKVKFFKGAQEEGEMGRVLDALVQAATSARR